MAKKNLLSSILFLLIFGLNLNAQTKGESTLSYEQLWKEVARCDSTRLPKSGLTYAHQLLEKARKEKDFPHIIAASISIAQFESDINPDSVITKMDSLEKSLSIYKEPDQQSIVHAMLVSCYTELLKSKTIKNDRDTRNKFREKKDEHALHILDNPEALMKAKAADYTPLITLQKDGEKFGHDLCGPLCDFIDELLPNNWENKDLRNKMNEQFVRIANLYKEKGMTYAYAFTKLKSLGGRNDHAFESRLLELINEMMGDKAAADLGLAYIGCIGYDKPMLAKWNHTIDDNIKYDINDHQFIFAKWMQEQMPELKDNEYYIQETTLDIHPAVSINSSLIDFIPNKNNALKFRVGNLDSFTYTITNQNDEVVTTHTVNCTNTPELTARKKAGLPLKTDIIDSLNLAPGKYAMAIHFEGSNDDEKEKFEISSLRAVGYPHSNGAIFVCNADDGRPVAGATINYEFEKKAQTIKTNKQGMAYLPFSKDEIEYSVVLGNDTLTDCDASSYEAYEEDSDDELYFYINTDRLLYRPGQTVKGKVIVYSCKKGVERPFKNKELSLLFENEDSDEELDPIIIKTNDMGSAAFEFALPKDCALGNWDIDLEDEEFDYDLDGKTGHFEVEEYKLPTFFVTFNPNDGDTIIAPAKGKEIKLVGQAITMDGVPVQFAKVNYSITKDGDTPLIEQECKTDKDGKFFITYKIERSDDMNYNIIIKASVTDQKGETQFEEKYINLSEEYHLSLVTNKYFDKASNDSVVIFATDAWRRHLSVSGHFKLMKELYRLDYVFEGDFVSGKSIEQLRTLECGKYYMRAESTDCNGEIVFLMDQNINIVDSNMPVTSISSFNKKHDICSEKRNTTDCLLPLRKTYNESEPIDLFFSTKETDVYFTCLVYDGNDNLVHSFSGVTDGNMKRIHIRGKKEWGNCSVSMFYVKNGILSRFDPVNLEYKSQAPEIKLAWSTFRNRLAPGQEETWTLKLIDAKGKPVANAEVMAELFDKALNYAHSKNVWRTYNNRHYTYIRYDFNSSSRMLRLNAIGERKEKYKLFTNSFDFFHGFVFDGYTTNRKRLSQYDYAPHVLKEVVVGCQTQAKEFSGLEIINVDEGPQGRIAGLNTVIAYGMQTRGVSALNEVVVLAKKDNTIEEGFLTSPQSPMRTNFSELAFFYPQLRTDKNGQVALTFTMPESLTGWTFQAFAHTKDMRHTIFFDQAITERLLTIRPNMPRFVRCGDEVTLTSTIINVTDSTVSGNAVMKLVRHEGEEVYIEQTCPFTVEANQTQMVSFTFKVDDAWYKEGIDCIVLANAGENSDGEKNFLPVLSRKQSITHATPYYIKGNDEGETSLTLELPEVGIAEGRTLSFEYTDNPAEACVEALKSIIIDKDNDAEDAITLSAKWYAASRLCEFADALPEVDKLIDKYAYKEGNSPSQLVELQNIDGGIAWYKGMKSNEHITMTVCEHLIKSKATDKKTQSIINKAMNYLDNEELKHYSYTLKHQGSINPSDIQLRYLYLSSLMKNRAMSDSLRMMHVAYLDYVSNNINQLTIYGVANSACALRAFGRTEAADKFVQSLCERTTTAPGQGRFYSTDAAYYSWRDYRIPTQVAAMEALHKHDANAPYLLDMQLWLLSQKRVQKWDNTLNTIDVVDLLLKINPEVTFHESKAPIVKYDNEADSALSRKVTITKLTPGISWGAIYLSFDKDISELEAHSTNELSIERKIFVQPLGTSEWTPYAEGTALNIGDKVRIHSIIKADRDMDFVNANIQHPACLEPLDQHSGYSWQDHHACYISRHDSSTDIRFDTFRRGTTTHDLDFIVSRSGTYITGISKVECQFAKMFGGYTDTEKMMCK